MRCQRNLLWFCWFYPHKVLSAPALRSIIIFAGRQIDNWDRPVSPLKAAMKHTASWLTVRLSINWKYSNSHSSNVKELFEIVPWIGSWLPIHGFLIQQPWRFFQFRHHVLAIGGRVCSVESFWLMVESQQAPLLYTELTGLSIVSSTEMVGHFNFRFCCPVQRLRRHLLVVNWFVTY